MLGITFTWSIIDLKGPIFLIVTCNSDTLSLVACRQRAQCYWAITVSVPKCTELKRKNQNQNEKMFKKRSLPFDT